MMKHEIPFNGFEIVFVALHAFSSWSRLVVSLIYECLKTDALRDYEPLEHTRNAMARVSWYREST